MTRALAERSDRERRIVRTVNAPDRYVAGVSKHTDGEGGEPMFPIREASSQRVVTVRGERTVLDASYVGPIAVGALQITTPTTDEYAIIQRTGWFCPTRPPAGQVSFQLKRSYALDGYPRGLRLDDRPVGLAGTRVS